MPTAFVFGGMWFAGELAHSEEARWEANAMRCVVAIGYQRVNHDAHWLSDTVAGPALGIATARFVMRRHEREEPRGEARAPDR